jgi:hypothetical protein
MLQKAQCRFAGLRFLEKGQWRPFFDQAEEGKAAGYLQIR